MENFYILTGGCGFVGTAFHDAQIFDSQEDANAYAWEWARQEAESYGDVMTEDDLDEMESAGEEDLDRVILESDIEAAAELYNKDEHGEEDPWGRSYADIYLQLTDPNAYKQMLIDREANKFDWYETAEMRFNDTIDDMDKDEAVAFLLDKIDYDVFKDILYHQFLSDEEREKA